MTKLSTRVMHRFACVLASLAMTTVVFAQGIPDERNINIIGVNPATAVDGVPDPGLKQQNEPACAMKPSNPLQILCAFNDYRGVDDPVIGDAWEGYAYSLNGGQTWFSDLLPGHPGDSPNIGLSFAADAQTVAAPGLALISYIAADRGDDAEGGLFLQRMFEVTREAGAPWAPERTPVEVARGSADEFIDKPFMLLHPAPAGTSPVTVSSMLEDGTPVSQDVAAATIFIAYTVFSGTVEDGDLMSKIIIASSDDYGESWTTTALANSTCELPGMGHCKDKGKGHKKGKGKGHTKRKDVIQSASLAAYGDDVCAVWRRFEDADDLDAIMVSCSSDRGETFALPSELSGVPDFSPFDQGTTAANFRTNSYPTIATDGSKFYAFWASRDINATPFFARIVYSTSVDGATWTTPVMLDDVPNGHQFMPAVAAARGTIQLAWLDSRNNLFQGNFIQDLIGDGSVPDIDAGKIIRNQVDVRTAQFKNGVPTNSVQVSRYLEGALTVDGPVEQLEFNFINDRIFKQGTVPFAGDYPNVAAPAFRLENGEWVSNIGPSANEVPVDFLVSWSDNRDVRGNVWNDLVAPTLYTPADQTPAMTSTGGTKGADAPADDQSGERLANLIDDSGSTLRADAEPDPTAVYGSCVPGTNLDRSRNQNVYSSVVRPGVSIDSPSVSKPNGTIQRAHVIWVSNNENSEQTYTLTIDNQPPDAGTNGRASFLQVPVAPFTSNDGLLTEIDVTIDANSTAARTVYVTSNETDPKIAVSVSDGGTVVYGTIELNGDILSPDVQNPDVQNPDVQNPDIQNAEVHNPDVQNVVITRVRNPDVQNPDVQNPDVQNPDVQNPDVQNPDVQNPDIQNPDVQNTSLAGSSTENPDVAYDPPLTPAEREAGYTDVTYEVTNNGNTTTSFNFDAFINGETAGYKTQLIGSRTHVMETSRDCEQVKVVQNQIIFNKINPALDLQAGDSDDGVFGDGSAFLAPGETIFVTLRVWGDPDLFVAEQVGVEVEAQSCNSVDKTAGTTDCDPPMEQGSPSAADVGFEFIPPLSAGANIIEVNGELERFGVNWEAQGGIFQLVDASATAAFPPLSGSAVAFNSTGQFDGTHTARFVCPDGSGRLATVANASFDIGDTEAVTVDASSFDINGVLLQTVSLPSPPTGTLSFTVGPIASIVITDTGGDGHFLDNLNYSGSECLPGGTVFSENVIIGDIDILSDGILVAANDLGATPSAVTVNGVAFGTNQGGLGGGPWAAGSGDFSVDAFSANLDALLSDLVFTSSLSPVSLSISGLTPGTRYRLQLLFSNDVNFTGDRVEVTVEDTTWILDDWQPDAINLVAQFTATSTSVVTTFAPGAGSTNESGRAVVNGYVLHDMTPQLACNGTTVGGLAGCWYLGGLGQSCTTTCATAGYNEFTRTVAGSDGNNEACASIMAALGAPGNPTTSAGEASAIAGTGCMVCPLSGCNMEWLRVTNPVTTANALINAGPTVQYQRACACNVVPPIP